MSPAVVDVEASPAKVRKRMAVPVAAKKTVEASPVVVNAGPPTKNICEKRGILVAAQKAGLASPASVDPPEKTCGRREAPVTVQEVDGMSTLAVSAEATLGRAVEKKVALVAAQKAGEVSLAAVDAGAPSLIDSKMSAPVTIHKAGELSSMGWMLG
jgi:hypothetical protein